MQRLKLSVLLCFLVVIATLVVSTLVDPLLGTDGLATAIYGSTLFTLLWAVLAVLSVCLLVRMKMWQRPLTLLFHTAFLVILAGALITHLTGKQGTMHLRMSEKVQGIDLGEEGMEKLPFSVTLKQFDVDYYPGTTSPQDYRSQLLISDGGQQVEAQVSMNKVVEHAGYRFYQSGYDADQQGTQLMVAHDPWGIGVTYCGYLLLLVAMIAWFFEPGSRFRRLLRQPAATVGMLLLSFAALPAEAQNMPKVAPTDVAQQMGDLYIYYNGRVAPLETFAHDFTTKLCGSPRYRGRNASEILAGWIFFPNTWKAEPMLKIKGAAKRAVGSDSRMVSLRQMATSTGEYKLQPLLDKIRRGESVSGSSDLLAADEKVSIINGVFTGAALKIFPVRDKKGTIHWYAAVDDLPQDMDPKQWAFIRKSMDLVAEKVMTRRYTEARTLLAKIKEYQIKVCKDTLPTADEVKAEKTYNRISSSKWWAMACVTIGLLAFVYSIWLTARRRRMHRAVSIVLHVGLLAVWLFLSYSMFLRWQISHHLPLSNGYETMQALAWSCFLLTLLLGRRMLLALPFGYLVGGLALMVAMIGQSNPAVTNLMPVLQSPLLSTHVMVIMIAYALLAFVMLNGIAALILSHTTPEADAPQRLQRTSLLMLYPAVFLLTTGIFLGAVWANVSWGRYWGWDPKEVWALITMMIYALPLHSSITWLHAPRRFHWFAILAFLAVLMTYFGVNFFLPGMHSYA